VLFIGFAFMAGGLAGGVSVMVLKYIVNHAHNIWYGIANVVANALIMLSSCMLWVSQHIEDEYQYNLAL